MNTFPGLVSCIFASTFVIVLDVEFPDYVVRHSGLAVFMALALGTLGVLLLKSFGYDFAADIVIGAIGGCVAQLLAQVTTSSGKRRQLNENASDSRSV